MFESAEIGHKIDKATFRREEPKLREALLDAQFDLGQGKRFATLIVIGGVDGAGKGETVNLLNEWMDPRHILTHAFPEPSDEERERPRMGRYWRALPPRGKIGIHDGAWHSDPIVERVRKLIGAAELDQAIAETVRFERMLTDEHVLLLKIWLHLSKQQQKKRLKSLQANPATRWRVTDADWEHYRQYDRFRKVSEHYLRQTNTAEAPWMVIEGADPEYRSLTVGRFLLAALRERLDDEPVARLPDKTPPLLPPIDQRNVVRALELDQPMTREKYRRELEKWQGRLNLASRHPRFRRMAVVAVFEGNDAAGKGGAIRRVTQALDARQYRGIPIAAPTDEERAHPYLWRFWRDIPRRGRFAIFDRSWYGRVLVERVEGYCIEADWMRAYPEINDFEHQLAASRRIVIKFWLAISKEEQLKRFREREKVSFKRFKITEQDWRNRKKWDAYERAVCDMVERTSTTTVPWTLVEANNKYYARIKILKTLTQAVERALKRANKKN
jgi:polyphosphate:AMP phosphotransferase